MTQRQTSGDALHMRGFGDRLKLLRDVYGEKFGAEHHSKARWAARLYVSAAMYGRWESGAHVPKFGDIIRITLLYRVDPNYLLAGVLSEHLPRWLYRALTDGDPQLLDVEEYWTRQSVIFEQASRALPDSVRGTSFAHSREARSASASSVKPPVSQRKRQR